MRLDEVQMFPTDAVCEILLNPDHSILNNNDHAKASNLN
jgi:hypothetical protein